MCCCGVGHEDVCQVCCGGNFASAGVTVGFVMYLCLKNTVAEMRVDQETGVHIVQHR